MEIGRGYLSANAKHMYMLVSALECGKQQGSKKMRNEGSDELHAMKGQLFKFIFVNLCNCMLTQVKANEFVLHLNGSV